MADYLRLPRETYLKDLEMLGLTSFVNKLKVETPKVIERLRKEVEVDVKMITGDNIYTAVQTAFKAGMLYESDTVVVCEARHVLDPGSSRMKVIVI